MLVQKVVRTVYGNSNGFEVKVGKHQGSALSPLLFVIVMEALSREFSLAMGVVCRLSKILKTSSPIPVWIIMTQKPPLPLYSPSFNITLLLDLGEGQLG